MSEHHRIAGLAEDGEQRMLSGASTNLWGEEFKTALVLSSNVFLSVRHRRVSTIASCYPRAY